MASAFTPQEQTELRKIARSAAASVVGVPWNDAKDEPMADTRRQEYLDRQVAAIRAEAGQ